MLKSLRFDVALGSGIAIPVPRAPDRGCRVHKPDVLGLQPLLPHPRTRAQPAISRAYDEDFHLVCEWCSRSLH